MRRLLIFGVLGALVTGAHTAASAADKDAATTRKTESGLHFQLPTDWPIEKRGGVVGPIPIEEYVARKMTSIESRLQGLEQQVGSIDIRLRVLEEGAKRQRTPLASQSLPVAEPPQPAAQPQTPPPSTEAPK